MVNLIMICTISTHVVLKYYICPIRDIRHSCSTPYATDTGIFAVISSIESQICFQSTPPPPMERAESKRSFDTSEHDESDLCTIFSQKHLVGKETDGDNSVVLFGDAKNL